MRDPVVADTVTLREFAESGRLDVLEATFIGGVHIPAAVVDELERSLPHAPQVSAILSAPWITQAIELARQINGALFCTDDHDAARIAKQPQYGLRVIGTPDVLREAVTMDTIRCEEAVALYAEMRSRQRNWPELGRADLCH